MKKTIKNVLLTLFITIVSISGVIGSVFVASKVSDAIDRKNNRFDVNETGFLALSYHEKNKEGKDENTYRYISTKLQNMYLEEAFASDRYQSYYIDMDECFKTENFTDRTLIKKEVKDKDDKPIPYDAKYDYIFSFVEGYSHALVGDITLYDLGKAVVVSYIPNVNFFTGMYVGYVSSTFTYMQLAYIDEVQPLLGIKLYSVL